MNCYEINEETLAILPYGETQSKIIEKYKEFIVDKTPYEIITYSCLYFGSSYEGRISATRYLLGISYKSPIVIEESRNLIFFPTNSPKLQDCSWISLKSIVDYKRNNSKSMILFENNVRLPLDISFGSLENRIMRASRLDSMLRNNR